MRGFHGPCVKPRKPKPLGPRFDYSVNGGINHESSQTPVGWPLLQDCGDLSRHGCNGDESDHHEGSVALITAKGLLYISPVG